MPLNNEDYLAKQQLASWLDKIDFQDARIFAIENEVLESLARYNYKRKSWSPTPIAPLAEPLNLNELVGQHFNSSFQDLEYLGLRLDDIYTKTNNLNNTFKAEVEGIELLASKASNLVQDLVVRKSQNTDYFYWISETFNSNAFLNLTETTCLIDTNHGVAMLPPKSTATVGGFTVDVDPERTDGIPGCNMLVLDRGDPGSDIREPSPSLETNRANDFISVFDGDPSTWFEVEKNFVNPIQKTSRRGRAFVYTPTGTDTDVKAATSNLDWTAEIIWFNKSKGDTGPDGKGEPIAEFVNLDNLNSGDVQSRDVNLIFTLTLDTPTELSFINLAPLVRNNQSVKIDYIKVFTDSLSINIAKNQVLNSGVSKIDYLASEVLRRTGSQNKGGLFQIPTNRPVTKIEISLSSVPELAPNGLAHPFKEQLKHVRREQRVIFFSIVRHEEFWERIPASDSLRKIESKFQQNQLFGSLPGFLNDLLGFGGQLGGALGSGAGHIQNSMGSIASILEAAKAGKTAQDVLKASGSIGKGVGNILGSLGNALNVVGGVLSVVGVVQSMFAYNKTESIKEVRSGFDIFKGYRAAVGIRDLSLMKIVFQPSGTIVSKRRDFAGPVSKIGLFAEEDIPETWGPGDWIKYYLSVDGSNWVEVAKTVDISIDGGFTPEHPVSSIYWKVEAIGNPADPTTPVSVKHIVLQGLPA